MSKFSANRGNKLQMLKALISEAERRRSRIKAMKRSMDHKAAALVDRIICPPELTCKHTAVVHCCYINIATFNFAYFWLWHQAGIAAPVTWWSSTYVWMARQMTSDPWPAFLSVMARFLALLASSRETLDGAFWGSFCLDSVRSTAGPWALVLNISSNSSTFRSWDTHRSSQILNRWNAFVSPEWCLLLWMLPAGWTRHQCHWRWFRLSDLASELPSSAPASWTWSGLASLSSPLCETCEQGDMWGEDETGLRLVLRVTKVQLCVQTDQSVCTKLLKVNRHHCTCYYCQVQVRQVSRSVWDRPTEVCFSSITNIGLQLNSWMSITLGLIRANLSLGLHFIYLYLFSFQVRVGMILQSEHTS